MRGYVRESGRWVLMLLLCVCVCVCVHRASNSGERCCVRREHHRLCKISHKGAVGCLLLLLFVALDVAWRRIKKEKTQQQQQLDHDQTE
ncbi:hypothetical protein GQ42DRAFT_8568 [Ramicandelaber brevisporus]|nr:hypothetical protein GQ42DRAFT_8568 [Ramicandelaber brevisporus]